MKKLKTAMAVFLCMICMFSTCMMLTVLAATSAEQDGLKAEIITDKNQYNTNENIEIKLNLTNSNGYSISNVQAKFTIPDGVTVKKGSINNTITTIEGDETKTVAITVIKNKTTNNTTNKTTNKTNTTNTNSSNTSVQTGDQTAFEFWIILMIGSGVLLFILLFYKKKRTGHIFLFLVCFVAVGMTTYPEQVQAASTVKSFVVEKEISIDGSKTIIQAEISYDYEKNYGVMVKDGTGSGEYAEGETVKIKAAEAPEGAHFVEWSVEKGSVTLKDMNATETTFIMPGEDVELQALYNVDAFILSVKKFTGGEIHFDGEELLRETAEVRTLKVPMKENEIFGTIKMEKDRELESLSFNGKSFNHDDIYGVGSVALSYGFKAKATETPAFPASLRLLGVMTGEKQELSIAVSLTNGTVQTIKTDMTEYLENFGSGEIEPLILDATLSLPSEASITGIIKDWNTANNGEISAEPMQQSDTYAVSAQDNSEELQTLASNQAWTVNDEIGVYMLKAGTQSILEAANNQLYFTIDGSSSFNATGEHTIYFPIDGRKVDFLAYYPFTQISDGMIHFDVSDQSDLSKLDLMTAKAQSTDAAPLDKNHSAVTMDFRHRMTKIKLNIQAGEGVSPEELKNLDVEITNQRTNAAYDPLQDITSVNAETIEDIPFNVTSDGTVAEAILLPNTAAGGLNPVIAGRKLLITLNETDEVFSWLIPDEKIYYEGDQNIYTVTLNRHTYSVIVIDGNGSGDYAPGKTVAISAPDVEGMQFIGWEIGRGVESIIDQEDFDQAASQTSFIMPECDVEIKAVYMDSEELANMEAEKITGMTEDESELN